MPYANQLAQYSDILSLSLGLKNNDSWPTRNDQENYPVLFSLIKKYRINKIYTTS